MCMFRALYLLHIDTEESTHTGQHTHTHTHRDRGSETTSRRDRLSSGTKSCKHYVGKGLDAQRAASTTRAVVWRHKELQTLCGQGLRGTESRKCAGCGLEKDIQLPKTKSNLLVFKNTIS